MRNRDSAHRAPYRLRRIAALLIVAGLVLVAWGASRVTAEVATPERYRELAERVAPRPTGGDEGAGEAEEADWEPLLEEGPDVVGWVQVSGTEIDYPVVQCDDNEFYLQHDMWGDFSPAGTVYADTRCDVRNGLYTLLYAHHPFASNKMFTPIANCFEQPEFDATLSGATATWSRPGMASLRLRPVMAMRVEADAALPQTFGIYSPQTLRSWLGEMLGQADARATDAELTIASARDALALATCTSNTGDPTYRTIVVFAG